ncbi:MAG: glycosyltransferase family 9 protein [Elusimicrobiales bacterium]|jgi:ADP-heptose:LPS heptosyltransferase|nr:glycosyltransferase family 9 protein [Elusimicrobiales bacterium]HOL62349.1 glycosyltransferase family 9 protein [Elusimicrobiales bacterium]HPO94478.1 glycosyltransferase family 9 protein [Elusimicrobiales bacterium]
MKILIFNTAGIGDFIALVPWIYFLKKQKKCEVTLLVSDRSYEYAKICPYADNVFYLKSNNNRINIFSFHNLKTILNLRNSYDFLINTYPSSRFFSKFLYGSAIRFVINKNNAANVFSADFKIENYYERYEDLFGKIGVFKESFENILWFKESSEDKIKKTLSEFKFKKILGLVTAGNTLTKRWDKGKWVDLINRIDLKNEFLFLIFSDKKNYDYVKEIYEEAGKDNLIFFKDLSLEDWICALKKCDFLISMDSAAMHIASILKIPSVIINGPSDPQKIAPCFNRDIFKFIYKKVSCWPCDYYACPNKKEDNMVCMGGITVEDVLKEFENIYEDSSNNNKA